jgi:agmatine deiminase
MKKQNCSILINILLSLVITLSIASFTNMENKPVQNLNNNYTVHVPAEFERQACIWIMWPSAIYNYNDSPVNPVMISLINALTPYIPVNIISKSNEEILHIKELLGNKSYNIHYYIINHHSIWARDVGPIFVKDNHNTLSVVDFGFNNYSRYGDLYDIEIDSKVDQKTAKALGLKVIKANLISEGGAIEFNGQGTMMTTESVALKRNPTLSKQEIEDEYKRVLGIKKIIWLKKGLVEDDDITSGHIDEFARFADKSTILLAQILPEDRIANSMSESSYLRLEENYNILVNSTDQDGNPFRIIRIPMPPTFYQEANDTDEIPMRSYLNYTITNGAVILPTYWKQGRPSSLKITEDQVTSIFHEVFPDRDIIGIDAENVNLWGGGLHCITQHMPAN